MSVSRKGGILAGRISSVRQNWPTTFKKKFKHFYSNRRDGGDSSCTSYTTCLKNSNKVIKFHSH